MLDFGHPLRWKPRSVAALVAALEESLSMGLTNQHQLTDNFREGIIAPWASEAGKLSLLRNASALNANQTMALIDRHGSIASPTLILWGYDPPPPAQRPQESLRMPAPAERIVLLVKTRHRPPQPGQEQTAVQWPLAWQ